MNDFLFQPGSRIHLVGIGGTGMSAIARVMLQQGYLISGSDRSASPFTEALSAMGATVYIGHDAAHIHGAQALIATSAANDQNPEIAAAKAKGLPIFRRSEMIGALLRGRRVIAAAGTHGKTTTTGMIAHILREAQRDPGFIIGSVLKSAGTNAELGRGADFVIEADEYDYMFLGLEPAAAVVTSVEWDHPDFFPTAEAFTEAFDRFAGRILPGGVLIACADDAGANALAHRREMNGGRVVRYGTAAGVDVRLTDVTDRGDETRFSLHFPQEGMIEVRLPLTGLHNALNAAAAITAARWHGVDLRTAAAALAGFSGTGRRFEVRADRGGIAVIDDYAHHPTAIRVTLAGARARYPDRAIWAVWQPHTFSRTQALIEGYATAFGAADHVIVTPIYAAREQPSAGIDGAWAAGRIAEHHRDVVAVNSLSEAAGLLRERVRPPAAIVIFSAGDAPQIGLEYLRI
ncbi:UDP-N-acetylmuramate--L-alanine ligase [Anaerolineae bacterium CFX9]|nr:UDP-N-acetylmuramate--L-alanine ligase [Anaerolineae bacterium CFX9]